MGSFLITWRDRFLASSKRVLVSVSLIFIVVASAAGVCIYMHVEEQRCNERAIYFVAWAGGIPYSIPYSISIDRRFDSEGANRNARDKTNLHKCIPVKYFRDYDYGQWQLVVRAYVCGNNQMTEDLRLYVESSHRTHCESKGNEKSEDSDSSGD